MKSLPCQAMTDTENDEIEEISKSQQKRDMEALKKLGWRLLEFSDDALRQLALPDTLLDAIRTAQRIKSNSARKRQMQFIGKLMRDIDATPIRKAIDAADHHHSSQTRGFHLVEELREKLLTEGDSALPEVLSHFPRCDRQHLRKLKPDYKSVSDDTPVDIYIAICDHYEPEWGSPEKATAIARVERWCKEYPAQFGALTDSTGRPPQHSFFFPQDEYAPEYLDALAKLCTAGFGEVEVHLHHDNDTKAGLTEKLNAFRETLFHQHGLLRRHPETGEIIYGFIHGNWALCN